MANLSTARTRLGLWGYATRPGNFGLPAGPVAPEVGVFGGFVVAEDAVVTLLAARDALVAQVVASDAAVPVIAAVDVPGVVAVAFDGVVTRVTAFDA